MCEKMNYSIKKFYLKKKKKEIKEGPNKWKDTIKVQFKWKT